MARRASANRIRRRRAQSVSWSSEKLTQRSERKRKLHTKRTNVEATDRSRHGGASARASYTPSLNRTDGNTTAERAQAQASHLGRQSCSITAERAHAQATYPTYGTDRLPPRRSERTRKLHTRKIKTGRSRQSERTRKLHTITESCADDHLACGCASVASCSHRAHAVQLSAPP